MDGCGNYIAVKSSRVLWFSRPAFQSLGYVEIFQSGMMQTVWHPEAGSHLVITFRPIPVVYHTNDFLAKTILITSARNMKTGSFNGAWLGRLNLDVLVLAIFTKSFQCRSPVHQASCPPGLISSI